MVKEINKNSAKLIDSQKNNIDSTLTFLYKSSGKRKNSKANVKISPGEGNVLINGKTYKKYLQGNLNFIRKIEKPLMLISESKNYDFIVTIKGGGLNGQSEAIVLAISKIILKLDKTKHSILKESRLLRQDVRIKERKKYGLKKARKASQYSKR